MRALTGITHIDMDLQTYLAQIGQVFRLFAEHDSGCSSYGVLAEDRRWFVKHSDDPRGIASLRRAVHVNGLVQHPALPRLEQTFTTPRGLALVYHWVPGESLYFSSSTPLEKRRDPSFAPVRFRRLPREQVLASLNTIYDVHLRVAEAGLIAVDFYDGCLIYDFERAHTYVYDLDEYRPGPFVLDAERLPGSSRLMAPEEFQRLSAIDQATNVFTLARMAVLLRATDPARAARYPTVRAFVDAWRQAAGPHVERWSEGA